MPHDPQQAIRDRIDADMDRLRIEAMERGMSFEEFTAAVIGNITFQVRVQQFNQRLARHGLKEAASGPGSRG